MRKAGSRTPLAAAILAACALATTPAPAVEVAWPLSVGHAFAASLDLDTARLIAVQEGGRLKSFDALAHETMKYVGRGRAFGDVDPVLIYLDMMLVPEHYANRPIVLIRKAPVRHRIIQEVRMSVPAAERGGPIADAELDRIAETGLASPAFLAHPVVRSVLSELARDLMRTNKAVAEIDRAANLTNPFTLKSLLRVVPPPGGGPLDAWFPIGGGSPMMPRDDVHAGLRGPAGIPGLAPELAAEIEGAWGRLESAWRFQDAQAANEAIGALAAALPRVAPALYPSRERLAWESWYYAHGKLTGTWLLYFLALPFLLMALVYRFRWARWTGLALFGAGFALHSFAIGLRWYLAGRIPNANMFEAILASAWFGCIAAVALELWLRRSGLANLPVLAASVYAMGAMMVGRFLPVTLNSDIMTVMPVLDRTVWLYIHTNMVIASYALIFFGGVTAALYLAGRLAGRLSRSGRVTAIWGGEARYAASPGGAAAIILGRGTGGPGSEGGLARSLDGATMVFLELAFVTLWVGTVLGAVWADVSWGRPWGWDPKEVFALNTWLVFLILVHVRLRARDKGFWTAVLAVLGCAVMLFNWIAVNFVIVGLHSYA